MEKIINISMALIVVFLIIATTNALNQNTTNLLYQILK